MNEAGDLVKGPGLTRRESLRRVALFAATSALPLGCTIATSVEETSPWSWPRLPPVTTAGYGTDPDLIHPVAPWPRIFDAETRALVAALADILIPAEGGTPAASEAGVADVADVLDEWASAPYPEQQADREPLFAGFQWPDREARRRHGRGFAELRETEPVALADAIASPEREVAPARSDAVSFTSRFRFLVAGMFYSGPEGIRELGCIVNVPTAGDWPGPTDEAMTHLREQLERLGLQSCNGFRSRK